MYGTTHLLQSLHNSKLLTPILAPRYLHFLPTNTTRKGHQQTAYRTITLWTSGGNFCLLSFHCSYLYDRVVLLLVIGCTIVCLDSYKAVCDCFVIVTKLTKSALELALRVLYKMYGGNSLGQIRSRLLRKNMALIWIDFQVFLLQV